MSTEAEVSHANPDSVQPTIGLNDWSYEKTEDQLYYKYDLVNEGEADFILETTDEDTYESIDEGSNRPCNSQWEVINWPEL